MRILLTGFTVSLILISVSAQSQEVPGSNLRLSLSAGTVFPGKVEASYQSSFKPQDIFSFTINQSLLLKASGDYCVLPHLSGGLSLEFIPIIFKGIEDIGVSDLTIDMTEIDGTIKGKFLLTKNFIFKPGIAIGYRHTFSKEEYARESGFCLNGGLELQYSRAKKYFLNTDFGFFTQPYGGVQDVAYIRAIPIFYASIGIGINL